MLKILTVTIEDDLAGYSLEELRLYDNIAKTYRPSQACTSGKRSVMRNDNSRGGSSYSSNPFSSD